MVIFDNLRTMLTNWLYMVISKIEEFQKYTVMHGALFFVKSIIIMKGGCDYNNLHIKMDNNIIDSLEKMIYECGGDYALGHSRRLIRLIEEDSFIDRFISESYNEY